MGASPRRRLLGTGRYGRDRQPLPDFAVPHPPPVPLPAQVQLVELLVAHGADLNGKSVLDETPLGECLVFFGAGGEMSLRRVFSWGAG